MRGTRQQSVTALRQMGEQLAERRGSPAF